MGVFTSQLLVQLIDRVTGPAKIVQNSIGHLGKAIDQNQRRLSKTQGQWGAALAGTAGLAALLRGPIQSAALFESKLLDIAQKADLSDQAMGSLGETLKKLGPSMGQTAGELAKGVDFLAGMGLSVPDATAIIGPIGKTATAYGATIEDLSKAGYATLTNLKVPATGFGQALEAMAQAGKDGGFELKDMAEYFPALTSAASSFGATGVKSVADLASALQVIRIGTKDSASAANALENILQKAQAPDAVSRFKKVGIDIRAAMAQGVLEGKSPIEIIAEKTNLALGGKLSNIGDLFQDAEVQKGLRPLITNLKLYQEIRARALSAQGGIEADYIRRLKTMETSWKAFTARCENLAITLGTILAPAIEGVLDAFSPVIEAAERWAKASPNLTKAVLLTTGALLALKVASFGTKLAFYTLKGQSFALTSTLLELSASGLRGLTGGFGLLARASQKSYDLLRDFVVSARLAPLTTGGALLKSFGRGILFLLNPLRLVRLAFIGLRLAMVSSGIGLILLAVAAAGVAIVQNWSGIKAMFAGIGEGFSKAFPAAAGSVRLLSDAVSLVVGWIEKLFNGTKIADESWKAFGVSLGEGLGKITSLIMELPTTAYNAGKNLVSSLWEGVTSKWDWLVGNLSEKLSSITNMFSFSFGSSEKETKEPTAPAGTATFSIPAMAKGGLLSARTPTLVGENGPELITSSQGGWVHNAKTTQGLLQGAKGQGARPISISFGNIIINGASDAKSLARNITRELEIKTKSALRALHADLEYTS